MGIRKVFELATQHVTVPGTEVIGFPLFEVLDGKCHADFVQRVEPRAAGGVKMASALMDKILASTRKGAEAQVVQHAAAFSDDGFSGRRESQSVAPVQQTLGMGTT